MDTHYLLANPNYLQKNKNKNNYENDLFDILKKLFPKYQIKTKYEKSSVLQKIESLLYNIQIESISNNLINNVFQDLYEEFDHTFNKK